MKKGQAAMEYLMTYGWVILIILIVGAVLYYYGAFSPSMPKSGCTTGNLAIASSDWRYEANGVFKFKVENRVGQEITLTSVSATSGGSTQTLTINQNVATGSKSGEITITGLPTGNIGSQKNIDIQIKYTVPGGISGEFTYSCSVSGKIGE